MRTEKKPFFTIGITTYNRASYLKLAIGSVLKQTFHDYEILILDNHSRDNTKEVVKHCQSISNKIRYIEQPYNVGHPKNFQQCFLKAKGKYLFVLADDDLILKRNTLNELYNYIRQFDYPGFIKINALFYHYSVNKIIKMFIFKNKFELIKPYDKNFVIELINKPLLFVSGSVYKINKRFIKYFCVQDKLLTTLEMTYQLTYNYGAIFVEDHYILARYAHDYDLNTLVKPIFSADTFLRINKKYSFNHQRAEQLDISVRRTFLIGTCNFKLFVNDKNLLFSIHKIFCDDKNFFINFFYYCFAMFVFIIPRFLLRLLKKIYYIKLTNDAKNYVIKNNLSKFINKINT